MAKPPRKTLFALLLRSPWWVSMLIAFGLFMVVRQFIPDIGAVFATFPFLVIGAYTAWRQLRAPSSASIAATLANLRAMSWQEFAAAMEAAFRRDGHAVLALVGGVADFKLHKNGRVVLVGCKRWKVSQTGVAPLRELHDATQADGAHECIYVAAGEVSPNARQYAEQNGIKLLSETDLAQFIARRVPA